MREGDDVTIASTGGMLQLAVQVSEALCEDGVGARVLSCHTLKPLDADALLAAARETKAIFTLEEHSIVGGLGSAVAELLAERDDVNVRFRRLGVPPRFSPRVGSQEYLLAQNGLEVETIRETVCGVLRRSASPVGAI